MSFDDSYYELRRQGRKKTELEEEIDRLKITEETGTPETVVNSRATGIDVLPTGLTQSEVQALINSAIDAMTTPNTQSTTGITSTGAGTTLDCSDKSYNIMKMTCIGQTNTGTFTSASVDLELSAKDTPATDADWEKVLTITPTTADPHVIDFVEFGAKHMRYNVTAISLVGDSDLDIELEAIV